MTKKELIDKIIYDLSIHPNDRKYVSNLISKYEREKYKKVLKQCLEAYRINLANRNYKDEVTMYEAFMAIEKVLNK